MAVESDSISVGIGIKRNGSANTLTHLYPRRGRQLLQTGGIVERIRLSRRQCTGTYPDVPFCLQLTLEASQNIRCASDETAGDYIASKNVLDCVTDGRAITGRNTATPDAVSPYSYSRTTAFQRVTLLQQFLERWIFGQ